MPRSDKILALKKLIDAEKDPQKVLEFLETLKKSIFGLPQKNLKQREQKASEYLFLGNLVHSLVTAKGIDVSYASIAELYNQGLNLIPVVQSSLSAELINGMATARFLNGETTLGIQFFQDAIRIYKELPLSDDRYGMVHANLAYCYLSVKNYSKALENYELAERLCKEPENKIINIFTQVDAFYQNNNFDAVLVNFDRALKELKTLYPDSKELPIIVYLKTQLVHAGRLRKAIFAYFTALLKANQYQRIIEFSASLLNDPSLCTYDDKLSLECVADAHVALEQFSAAIECYDRLLHDLQLHTEYYARCSEKRVQCILAYGQHLYEQNDLPNALLKFQKVTSEVYFGENNLNNLFEALTMSIDILIRQNNRNDAMQDYERASSIGEQLGKNNDFYKRDTAILHYKMVEYIEDETSKLSKYLLIYNILENLCLNEETWPIFIDVTAKIGAINLKRKDYSDVADKLDMILHHIPTEKKEQHVVVRKNLIYALLCLENFDDATEEINKLLAFLGDDQQELRICLLVYKAYCCLKMNQPASIEFTLEAIDQLFIIDPLVIEAKILGYKILGDNYSSQEQYAVAVKCYQETQSLLSKHKVDINIFNPKEITENLNTALKQTDVLAALQNLLRAEDVFDKHKEIIIVGLKVLEIHLQQSQVNLFYSVIELIEAALREKVPSIAYDFFETIWERLQRALIIGVKLTPEEYRKLTPEECKQAKNVQRILIYKQSEYRGEYRDEHQQRGEPLVTVPTSLLTKTIKYIASNEQPVVASGVPNLGREKTVEHIQKIVVETKSDGTNAATVLKEPIKKRFTPVSAGVASTISNVEATLLEVGFFSPKFEDPELEDLDACQPIRLFDALAAENARFENEKRLVNMENKQRQMEDMQKSIYAAQQEQKVTQAQIAADLSALREMLQQTKKRKHEEINEEDTIVRSAKLNK